MKVALVGKKTPYDKINDWLTRHEQGKYAEYSLERVADYIDWCWKWRKINEEEKDELCDRICALFEAETEKLKERRMKYAERKI